MGQEPEELRRDIERRRDELGDTIDAIGDRVSPGRIIERRRNRTVDSIRSLQHRVMGTVSSGADTVKGTMTSGAGTVTDAAGSVRDHLGPEAVKQQTTGSPLGAGLVAFGIGFLVAAALPATQTEAEAAGRAQDALEPAKQALTDAARHVADDVKEGATEAARELKETAAGAASDVADTAKQEAASVKDDARQAATS